MHPRELVMRSNGDATSVPAQRRGRIAPRRAIFGTWACRLGLAWGRKRRVRAADRPGRGRGGLRYRAPDRDTSLDVTRPSVPPPWADGTAVAHTVPMSATRYRDGCLSVFLLAGVLALAPRSDAAWAAVAGSHAGGHVGGFRGGGRLGMDVRRGGEFGGGFVGRRSGDQRFAHGRHH